MTGTKLQPWLRGIIDTLVGARFLHQTSIPHRNRLVVILLDSALETGCRAYLRHKRNIKLEDVHKNRNKLMAVAKSNLSDIDQAVWSSLDFYYDEIRNDFYHDSASKTLTDIAILDYEETVSFVLDQAFSVRFKDLVETEFATVIAAQHSDEPTVKPVIIDWSKLASKTERLLAAASVLAPRKFDEVNNYFKKEGVRLRLTPKEFSNIVARNAGSRNLFYFDRDQKRWGLSALGRFKLNSLLSKEIENV